MEAKTKRFDWRQERLRGIAERVAVALLILLFFYASISKLADLPEFRRELYNQVIPEWSKKPLLWALPLSELFLSAALIFDRTRKWGIYGVILMMAVFTTYMGLVLLKLFPRVPCSCGGVLKSMDFPGHFIFNLAFLIVSLFALSQQSRKK